MRNAIIQFTVVFILTACKYDSIAPLPTSVRLKIADGKFAITSTASVSLDSIVSDSRCPENANCIWAGNAEARFIFFENSNKVNFNLNTFQGYTTETMIHGFRFKLMNLIPYPADASIAAKQTDYQAEVLITSYLN